MRWILAIIQQPLQWLYLRPWQPCDNEDTRQSQNFGVPSPICNIHTSGIVVGRLAKYVLDLRGVRLSTASCCSTRVKIRRRRNIFWDSSLHIEAFSLQPLHSGLLFGESILTLGQSLAQGVQLLVLLGDDESVAGFSLPTLGKGCYKLTILRILEVISSRLRYIWFCSLRSNTARLRSVELLSSHCPSLLLAWAPKNSESSFMSSFVLSSGRRDSLTFDLPSSRCWSIVSPVTLQLSKLHNLNSTFLWTHFLTRTKSPQIFVRLINEFSAWESKSGRQVVKSLYTLGYSLLNITNTASTPIKAYFKAG